MFPYTRGYQKEVKESKDSEKNKNREAAFSFILVALYSRVILVSHKTSSFLKFLRELLRILYTPWLIIIGSQYGIFKNFCDCCFIHGTIL